MSFIKIKTEGALWGIERTLLLFNKNLLNIFANSIKINTFVEVLKILGKSKVELWNCAENREWWKFEKIDSIQKR